MRPAHAFAVSRGARLADISGVAMARYPPGSSPRWKAQDDTTWSTLLRGMRILDRVAPGRTKKRPSSRLNRLFETAPSTSDRKRSRSLIHPGVVPHPCDRVMSVRPVAEQKEVVQPDGSEDPTPVVRQSSLPWTAVESQGRAGLGADGEDRERAGRADAGGFDAADGVTRNRAMRPQRFLSVYHSTDEAWWGRSGR